LRDFSDKALKWQISDAGLRAFLVLPDLSQCHSLFQACTGGVSASLSFRSVSVERRFQKLDLDPEQLVFDYQPGTVLSGYMLSRRQWFESPT
jgi:hypothetical protein